MEDIDLKLREMKNPKLPPFDFDNAFKMIEKAVQMKIEKHWNEIVKHKEMEKK